LDEAAAADLSARLEPPVFAQEVAPGGRVFARHERAEDDAVAAGEQPRPALDVARLARSGLGQERPAARALEAGAGGAGGAAELVGGQEAAHAAEAVGGDAAGGDELGEGAAKLFALGQEAAEVVQEAGAAPGEVLEQPPRGVGELGVGDGAAAAGEPAP